MMTTTLAMKRPGCKLVLGLLLLTTITSSLGVQRSSWVVERQRRRRSIIDMPPADRYKPSNFASSSYLRDDRLTLPASSVIRNEIRAAETTLPDDEKQFPVKRRWNSGNLRVWGKRSSALPATSSVDDRLYGQRNEGPIWLLSARAINNEQAPVHHTQSHDADEARVRARLWDRSSPRAWESRQGGSTRRSH